MHKKMQTKQVFAYFCTRSQATQAGSPESSSYHHQLGKFLSIFHAGRPPQDQNRSQVWHSSWPGEATNSPMPACRRQRSVDGDMVCVNLSVVGTVNKRTSLSTRYSIHLHLGRQNGNTIIHHHTLNYSQITARTRRVPT